ncbi:MAG: VTT domain-containing protein [Candidatus Aenigmatarchaeota archaeon]|nr:MAG: VTT domain-containing protein [Candidatus Aenigmarchaeota archaeon]
MDLLSLVSQFILWSQGFAITWGYLGIFLVSIIGNATIFFPIPSFAVVFVLGAVLDPWLVGVVAGVGAAIGELTGYLLGRGGRELLKKRNRKWFTKAKRWSEKRGVFPVIIIFAATPIPYDIIGILCGVIKYNLKKFFLATLIGKIIINVLIAWAGSYSVAWVVQVFGWA